MGSEHDSCRTESRSTEAAVARLAAAVLGAATLASAVVPTGVLAADALDVSQLEQEVRELRREVERQGRRLAALEGPGSTRQHERTGPRAAPARTTAAAAPDARWLDAGRWAKVKTGLGELDVVALLGPPSSMRSTADGRRTLYYALEIGTSGNLAGNVVLRDGRVVGVETPRLR